MNEFLELEFWRVIGMGVKEDTPVVLEEPEVPSQPCHIRPNGNDPLPMSLRLMLNGEGNEIGPVQYPTLGRSTGGLDCQVKLDRSQIIKTGHHGMKMKVEENSIVSSRYVGSTISKKSPKDRW
ncbi:hypothetical protein GOBAR_AA37145 [Gossypium barbadense]|uniref:Uncharacterized protein n=1 Tax=Gossypium barbadense TaxID=3634 RepID=A0A2P5VXM5_GOSBA|nr:hypothetical protein GOBAR_AA37145 [Gossypium barbadense]